MIRIVHWLQYCYISLLEYIDSESPALVPLMTLCSSLSNEIIDFLCQPSTLGNSTLLQN